MLRYCPTNPCMGWLSYHSLDTSGKCSPQTHDVAAGGEARETHPPRPTGRVQELFSVAASRARTGAVAPRELEIQSHHPAVGSLDLRTSIPGRPTRSAPGHMSGCASCEQTAIGVLHPARQSRTTARHSGSAWHLFRTASAGELLACRAMPAQCVAYFSAAFWPRGLNSLRNSTWTHRHSRTARNRVCRYTFLPRL